mgnify:CR=1 FL=1
MRLLLSPLSDAEEGWWLLLLVTPTLIALWERSGFRETDGVRESPPVAVDDESFDMLRCFCFSFYGLLRNTNAFFEIYYVCCVCYYFVSWLVPVFLFEDENEGFLTAFTRTSKHVSSKPSFTTDGKSRNKLHSQTGASPNAEGPITEQHKSEIRRKNATCRGLDLVVHVCLKQFKMVHQLRLKTIMLVIIIALLFRDALDLLDNQPATINLGN